MDSGFDENPTFFRKNRKILILLGILVALFALGSISVLQTGSSPSASKNKDGAADAGRAALGGVNPTAEFNKTFADQLRVELATKLDAERKAQRELSQSELARQAADFQASLASQKQEILNAMAAARPPEQDPGLAVKKAIRPPSQSTKPLDAFPQGGVGGAAPSLSDKISALVPIVAPTGFIRATMINGVVAQADLTRTFLGRLEGDYVSANGFRIALDGCLVTIEGTADVSASRIDGKPAVLTCNFDGGFSKSWDVAGYIVDEDGIRGIRGVTVNNFENKLIAGSVAGTLSGLGEALRQKQTTQTASGNGGVASNITGSVGGVVAGAALSGIGTNAAAALAENYRQYKTTVQTGAGTKFSITLLSELTVPKEGSYITPLTTRK